MLTTGPGPGATPAVGPDDPVAAPPRVDRTLGLTLAVVLLGPAVIVLLWAGGVAPRPATALVVVAAGAVAVWSRAGLAAAAGRLARSFGPIMVLGFAAALAVATYYQARLAGFIIDPARIELSVLPSNSFFREHSCLSSYTEAARFAAAGVNIYEFERYVDVPAPGEFRDRRIGPLAVDVYQYPPGFLLLPDIARRLGLDFFTVRALWFVVQTFVLLLAMVWSAHWIGGRTGTAVLLLTPILWIAPTTRLTLQIGNFQITALALGVISMLAFERSRGMAGGSALGCATISKIFPGVLGLVLLASRRWTAVAWTAAAAMAFTLLAWMLVGSRPFVDFLAYQLPRIHSGAAFFWIEDPAMAPVNQSIYGLMTKLRLLGLPFTDAAAAAWVSSLYAAAVFVLALVAGWRLSRSADAGEAFRFRAVTVWLALMTLASFRSPFVPDAYGTIGTVWLLSLIAASRPWPRATWIAFAVLAVALSITLDGGSVPTPVPAWLVACTLTLQLAVLALNVAAVLRSR